QLLSGFKFLGLIDSGNNTQPTLKQLVDATENSQQEKDIMSGILRQRYGKLFEELDLKTATMGQIEDKMGSYGPSGATRRRAARFFLKAAQYSGVPLPSRLTGGLRSRPESAPNGTEGGATSPQSAASRPRRRRRNSIPAVSEQPNEKPT